MNTLYVDSFDTQIGRLQVASTEKGLALVMLPGEQESQFEGLIRKQFPGYKVERGGRLNEEAQRQIVSYANGILKEFTLPLDWAGTAFQRKVLERVARVPYGRTMTYGEIAAAIGVPGGSRAVGHANARNPVPLVIPCHRVVASNGLGGYGGGIDLKRRLLVLEGAL